MTTTLTAARTLLIALALSVVGVASLAAQQPEAGGSLSFTSLERIRAALQEQQPVTDDGARLVTPAKPDGAFLDRLLEHPTIFQLGVLRFVTPGAGLFIDARLPIGDLATHVAHSVAAAHHRRAENAAHAEVVKALAEFQKGRPN